MYKINQRKDLMDRLTLDIEKRCRQDAKRGKPLSFIDVSFWCKEKNIVFRDLEGHLMTKEQSESCLRDMVYEIFSNIKKNYIGGGKVYISRFPDFSQDPPVYNDEEQLCIDIYHRYEYKLKSECTLY